MSNLAVVYLPSCKTKGDFHSLLWHTNRIVWHTHPDCYALETIIVGMGWPSIY